MATRMISMKVEQALLDRIDLIAGPGRRTRWMLEACERQLEQSEAVDLALLGPESAPPPAPARRQRTKRGAPARRTAPAETEECAHPHEQRRVLGWGTLCGACGARL